MTREEILSGFAQACKELKLYLEGKMVFKSAEDFLKEI